MKFNIAVIIFLALVSSLQAEDSKISYGLRAGMIFGGPIPTEMSKENKGNPKLGTVFGLWLEKDVGSGFSIRHEVSLAYKGVDFSAEIFDRDTLVPIMQFDTVPTTYDVFVNGEMRFLYLDLPIFISFNIPKITRLSIGIMPSFLLTGKYEGKANIIVGEGGFKDTTEKFNTFNNINKFDFSICLGGGHQLFNDLIFSVYASRSIINLSKSGTKSTRYANVGKLYNTYVVFSLLYQI